MQEFLVLWWNFNRFTTWILDPCHFFTIIQQRLTNCSEVLRKWIADKSAFRVNTELSSQHIPNLNQFAPYPVVFHKPKISQKKNWSLVTFPVLQQNKKSQIFLMSTSHMEKPGIAQKVRWKAPLILKSRSTISSTSWFFSIVGWWCAFSWNQRMLG